MKTSRNLLEFERAFERNLRACTWEPHPQYSVFTQYDQEYYLQRRSIFLYKYRSMYAVARTVNPKRIIELGTAAGSSADAYLSAAPAASYLGLDKFGAAVHRVNKSIWDPFEIATKLFEARGFTDYELLKVDLRTLERLPHKGDFVVVDAAHDFENACADLLLALTASPRYIFVDDAEGTDVKLAIEQFLKASTTPPIDFVFPVMYQGGGLLIKLAD